MVVYFTITAFLERSSNHLYKLLILLLLCCSVTFGEEWQVDKKSDNSVVFHSSTTLLDFQGKTDHIDGYIYWEGDSLLNSKSDIYFEVALATFETGIGKRDSDMRRDVLETEKYPLAKFSGIVINTKRTTNQIELKAKGKLSLHGVEKPLIIKAVLQKINKKMRVKSTFSVLLKDYNIAAPTLMAFIKVAQEIKIEVSLNLFKARN